MHAFKGIFFVRMQPERRALGLKNSQKRLWKNQDGILIKIFNDKSWPQQEGVFWNFENLEKVKSKLEKMEFHYVTNSKGIPFKAL